VPGDVDGPIDLGLRENSESRPPESTGEPRVRPAAP
jgi:hypothetical protein